MIDKLLPDHGATVGLPQGEKNNDMDLVNAQKLHQIIGERIWSSEYTDSQDRKKGLMVDKDRSRKYILSKSMRP